MTIDVGRWLRTTAAIAATVIAPIGCTSATSTDSRSAVTSATTTSTRDSLASTTTSPPSGAASPTGALPAACTLITQADASRAFGENAIAGDQSSDECWWSTANDLKTVNIIRRSDDLATWRAGYRNQFWIANDLGDEGYTGKAVDSVVFRIGGDQYEINVVYSTKGDPRTVVQDLAATVISRL
jgi:hypothetical protein